MDRRAFLAGSAACGALVAASARADTAPPPARVVLLGTAGGPPPHADRSQPATVVEAGGRRFLVDAGEGAAQQLRRAGISPAAVDRLLFTHLHWDHTLGLDYLMASGWMLGRKAPMPVWGPPGTRALVEATGRAVAIGEDIFRAQSAGAPPLASLYPVQEFDLAGARVIDDADGVRITAVPNSHFDVIHAAPHAYGTDKSYAYRFDTPQGSVVITGDTGPSARLEALAKGADMLVAEVVDLPSIRANLVANGASGERLDTLMVHMARQHLDATAVGQLAARAGVRTLVLTHFVSGPGFVVDDLVKAVRAAFPQGQIVAGHDLQSLPLVTRSG